MRRCRFLPAHLTSQGAFLEGFVSTAGPELSTEGALREVVRQLVALLPVENRIGRTASGLPCDLPGQLGFPGFTCRHDADSNSWRLPPSPSLHELLHFPLYLEPPVQILRP